MKKLFTLLALAMCVLGSYASITQTFTVPNSGTYVSNQVITTCDQCPLTLGNDSTKWTVSKGTLVGNENPVNGVKLDKVAINTTITGISQKFVPTTGCYYVFNPKVAGSISANVKIGKNKALYVTDIDGKISSVTMSTNGYTTETDGAIKYSNGADKVDVQFNVDAGKTYYLFCTGSKLTFYSYTFTYETAATEASTTTVALSASGMGTFSSTMTYQVPDGLNAYTVSVSGSVATLTKVEDGIIPAGTGVVLSGEANKTYTLTSTTSESTSISGNILQVAPTARYVKNDNTYVLICNSSNKGQFARLKSGEIIPKGKAFISAVINNDAGANFLTLDFGTETAIKNVEVKRAADDNYYSLDGKKIVKPQHGAYIHNGKVYVAK